MKAANSVNDLERRRRQLLESVPVAFLLTDVHSKIVYANRQSEYLFGYSRSELVGKRTGSELFLSVRGRGLTTVASPRTPSRT